MFEKSIRVSTKQPRQGKETSFVQGAKETKIPKPKSLTPLKKK